MGWRKVHVRRGTMPHWGAMGHLIEVLTTPFHPVTRTRNDPWIWCGVYQMSDMLERMGIWPLWVAPGAHNPRSIRLAATLQFLRLRLDLGNRSLEMAERSPRSASGSNAVF